MALFDFLKSKKQNNRSTESAFISDNKGKGISFDEAKKMRDNFLSIMEEDDRSIQFNAASGLMLNKSFDECIEAYQLLLTKYPDSIGLCESQIGACFYFKGDYNQAIAHYIIAREKGENEDMMDDNIWEACETLYKKSNDSSSIAKYISLYPNGRYIKKAQKYVV